MPRSAVVGNTNLGKAERWRCASCSACFGIVASGVSSAESQLTVCCGTETMICVDLKGRAVPPET